MSNDPPAPAEQAPMPPADTFDILPALHELLSRVDHHSEVENGTGQISTGDQLSYTEVTPLEPRELPTEVLAIKQKIRKALREVEKLADMDRTVQQQELEIKGLEQRIARQRQMLQQIAGQAQAVFG